VALPYALSQEVAVERVELFGFESEPELVFRVVRVQGFIQEHDLNLESYAQLFVHA
jgi:hypothetical protein